VRTYQQDAYYDNISYFSDHWVIIADPKSYYLQEHTDLTVQAMTSQLPTDWGVKFVFDSTATIIDSISPFEVLFTGVELGEHVIDAFIVDDSGAEVTGATTYDTSINVGIGDYYVAIGDSITYGLDDDVPIDDVSNDGRNSGGGYEPILNDLLTAFHGYPQNIVNEGVPGADSALGVLEIPEILSRHQNASKFLVQYGTNDAGGLPIPVPSGLGLNPGDSGYPGSFKDNMQQMIDAINNSGKKVSLAKIPIALGIGGCKTCDPYPDPPQAQQNITIREYNQVIDELVADPLNGIVVIPPDFYAYFSYFDPVTNRFRYEDEYATFLHPNGIGYQSMADLWYQALTQ
jgi:lysophospholipase L1-like esterase